MNKKYVWQPGITAPRYYPSEAKFGFVYYGKNDNRFPIMDRMAGNGIGRCGGSVALSGDGGLNIPKGLDIIWLSLTEVKFYEYNDVFPQEVIEKMAELFEQGYYDKTQKRITYDQLVMTLLPGGRILLHLVGIGRFVHFATLQAHEIEMTLDEFTRDSFENETLEEYCKADMTDYKGSTENLKRNGIPYGLWDKYLERFNYDIKIEFENKEVFLKRRFKKVFTNGDLYYHEDGILVNMFTRIKHVTIVWTISDTVYTGHFYFNEDEVLEIFDKAYGNDRTQHGEFVIRVSKYNNFFDISLRIGDREYKFEKTQIHVFKVTPETPDDDETVFYDNYRGKDPQKFIGE